MRSLGAIAGLILTLGGGYIVFQRSMSSASQQTPPQEQIDVVSIRQKLITVGQAERQYLVAHSTYATLQQLSEDGLLPGGADLRGYTLSAVIAGADHFTITATPTDASKMAWPTLEIGEALEVTQR